MYIKSERGLSFSHFANERKRGEGKLPLLKLLKWEGGGESLVSLKHYKTDAKVE